MQHFLQLRKKKCNKNILGVLLHFLKSGKVQKVDKYIKDFAPLLLKVEKVEIIISCPHCGQFSEIIELNCRIFRCGVFKHNLTQIPPHETKEICDDLKLRDVIFGCGKPFRLLEKNRTLDISGSEAFEFEAVVCDYI